ncbi:MAG TPA: AAA family ATPase [Methylomirabilota bacterium]
MRSRRIHIFGASGSGTSSLAAAVARRHGHRHLDTDDFYWMPTDPPFRQVRPRDERLARLESALEQSPTWVLSGSLCGWGDPLIPRFDLVVYLLVPTPVRLARLHAREQQRYGAAAIAAGGPLHPAHVEFMDWAGRYDSGGPDMRSRAMHEAWLASISAPVVRLEGDHPMSDLLARLDLR